MLAIDMAHNIGGAANPFVAALRTLQKSPGEDIAHLFTRRKNCPTPSVSQECHSINDPALCTISGRNLLAGRGVAPQSFLAWLS